MSPIDKSSRPKKAATKKPGPQRGRTQATGRSRPPATSARSTTPRKAGHAAVRQAAGPQAKSKGARGGGRSQPKPQSTRRTVPPKTKRKGARAAASPKPTLAGGRLSVQAEAVAARAFSSAWLVPIDILLYRGKGLISAAIRFFDGTEVSHASLFLGGAPPAVDEALAKGLVQRSLTASVNDNNAWVMARRLKVRPADVQPVLAKASFYLDQHERYAYEKILLLAFLCLIRKPKITPIWKQLIIAVLENASELLLKLTAGGKQPMICSEFVYRCYEALPGTLDPFGLSLRRAATPEGIRTPGGRHQADPVHPESVLAAVMESHERGGRAIVRAETAHAPADLRPLIQRYQREVKEPRAEAAPTADAVDSDVAAAVSSFAAHWQLATAGKERTVSPESLDLSAALASLYHTPASFVTPGDLLRNVGSLMTLGTLSV